MNIYISNLSFDTTSESLKELFAEHWEIVSAKVVMDRATGFSRGFGFVEMANENNGRKAIEELNEMEFEGKTINVNLARPKSDRNSSGWNNRSGGGYNRRQY